MNYLFTDYDLINWIGGLIPISVYADLDYSMGWNRESRAYLTVDYSDGVKGQLMSIYSPDTKFTGKDLIITFVGENGYMRIERPDRIVIHAKSYHVVDVEPIDNLTVFSLQLQKFINCLEQGQKYQPDANTAALTTFMVEAERMTPSGNRKKLNYAKLLNSYLTRKHVSIYV